MPPSKLKVFQNEVDNELLKELLDIYINDITISSNSLEHNSETIANALVNIFKEGNNDANS